MDIKKRFASPGGNPAGCPVPAVKPVLQVDLGLSYQVVRAQEVPVQNLDSEDRVLGEGGLELEALAVYWIESGLATNSTFFCFLCVKKPMTPI